jgi:EamA-like transporter family
MHQSVLWGLISALSYGIADYISQIAGRTVGVWRTSFYYYFIGFIALSCWLLFQPIPWHAPPSAWAAGVLSGLLLLFAVVSFTQGLVKGQIAAAAIAYGGGFWLQGTFAVPKLGPLVPIWLVYTTGLLAMGLLYALGMVRLAPPDRLCLLIPTLWASICSIGGFVALAMVFPGAGKARATQL